MLKKKTISSIFLVFALLLGLLLPLNAQQQTNSLKSCESAKAILFNRSNKNTLLFSSNLSFLAKTVDTPRNIVLEHYIRSSSIGMDDRSRFFSELSPEDKSNLVRFHFAFQFVKHPEFNRDQKQIILDSISIASPETYLENNRVSAQQQSSAIQQRAMRSFSQETGNEIFAVFSGTNIDIEILRKYQTIISMPVMADRRAAFGQISPLEKSLIYKIQMAFSLGLIPSLNREQQELVLEVMSQTKPELYQNRNFAELKTKRDSLNALTERITKVFPRNVGITTFAAFGDDGPPIDEAPGRCHCLRDSWFSGCSISSGCTQECDTDNNGATHCGFLGLWACDGRCK